MNDKFLICYDKYSYEEKPSSKAIKKITNIIAKNEIKVSIEELKYLILDGHTWCTTTFINGKKLQDEMKSQQLFALDFDGGISKDEVLARAEKYNLPIVLLYETLSSTDWNRFRAVFAHHEPVMNKQLAKLIQLCIYEMFPEADYSSKDFTKLYFPGKEAYMPKTEKCFYLYDLLINMPLYLKERDSAHCKRKIETIAKTTGIVLQNNTFKIDFSQNCAPCNTPLPPLSEDKNGETVIYTLYIKDDITNSPFFGQIYFYNSHENNKYIINNSIQETHVYCQKIDYNGLERKCRLFDEFVSGKRKLIHHEWFGLSSNLIHMQKGLTIFTETLLKYPDYYDNADNKLEQVKRMSNSITGPMYCEKFCTYADECSHYKNIALTAKQPAKTMISLPNNDLYYPIAEVRQDLFNKTSASISITSPGISIIKAQTGIGKTEAILQLMKYSDRPFIIALPTHQLIQQVSERAEKNGIDFITTPDIKSLEKIDKKLYSEINSLFLIGAETEVLEHLRVYNKKHKTPAIESYINQMDKLYSCNSHIITTHARLIYMKESFLANRTIIIDEDIAPTLLQHNYISIEDFNSILNLFSANTSVLNFLHTIQGHCNSNSEYFSTSPFFNNYSYADIVWKLIRDSGIRFSSNVMRFFYASSFYYDDKKNCICFIDMKHLYQSCRYTVLSATADEQLYRYIFKKHSICFNECKKVKYAGSVILHHDRTYSRKDIINNEGLYEKLHLEYPNCFFITFKDYDPMRKEGDLYFGMTHGFDHMKGKNLVVVGTPHKPEYVYKLTAMQLNVPYNDTLSMKEIEYNGFRFYFSTYNTPELRRIQLWNISTDLEQAVGRARIINNDVTIDVYSNLPVEQNILISSC